MTNLKRKQNLNLYFITLDKMNFVCTKLHHLKAKLFDEVTLLIQAKATKCAYESKLSTHIMLLYLCNQNNRSS